MNQQKGGTGRALRCVALTMSAFSPFRAGFAQDVMTPEQELQQLSAAVTQAQAQVDASQKQLLDLKRSLASLQERLAHSQGVQVESDSKMASSNAGAISDSVANPERRNETQQIQESQLATLNQIKVESASKYPVSIHGLILMNGFINSSNVDVPLAPSVALSGSGSTGASLRQTSFGIDAHGPTLAGASSHADFEIDFLGNAAAAIGATASGLVRLRTAHAALDWSHTRVFFEFDRPILNPYAPTSLVANAQPALAWSGNLWQWVPQAGLQQSVRLSGTRTLEMSAALVDDPDVPGYAYNATYGASAGEASRRPGGELHFELAQAHRSSTASVGVGGFISPHRLPNGQIYDAWAGTLDWQSPFPWGLSLTGEAYRGLALGGLGGGSYKDTASRQQGNAVISAPLDNVGGWAQLKKTVGQRLQFNAALGLDQAFAKQLATYPLSDSTLYGDLARNRTTYGNAIWSPSAYLLFSFEYRRISSYSASLPVANTNVFGIAAGYKF